MNKRIVLCLFGVVCFLGISFQTGVQSAFAARKDKEPKVENIEAKTEVQPEKQQIEPMKLDGTRWNVDVTNRTDRKDTQKDTLVFEDNKFCSDQFKNKGYTPTNYTLSVTDEGVTAFETMQTKDTDTIFWRGEMIGQEKINGIISVHPSEKAVEDYSFIGSLVKETQPEEIGNVKEAVEGEAVNETGKVEIKEEIKEEVKEEVKEETVGAVKEEVKEKKDTSEEKSTKKKKGWWKK